MYQLLPAQSVHRPLPEFAWWDDVFSAEQLESITATGDGLELNAGGVGEMRDTGGDIITDIRDSDIGWINSYEGWLPERLGWAATQMNHDFFHFDLTGFHEHFQYTVYTAGEREQHYNWHYDMSKSAYLARKLSLVLELTDPAEYEGGQLQLNNGGAVAMETEQVKGRLFAFPSFMLHRVTPVTRGTRKSLVSWIGGPQFR